MTISAIVKAKLAGKIARLATEENRTLSKMVAILIEEALKKRGV